MTGDSTEYSVMVVTDNWNSQTGDPEPDNYPSLLQLDLMCDGINTIIFELYEKGNNPLFINSRILALFGVFIRQC